MEGCATTSRIRTTTKVRSNTARFPGPSRTNPGKAERPAALPARKGDCYCSSLKVLKQKHDHGVTVGTPHLYRPIGQRKLRGHFATLRTHSNGHIPSSPCPCSQYLPAQTSSSSSHASPTTATSDSSSKGRRRGSAACGRQASRCHSAPRWRYAGCDMKALYVEVSRAGG